MRKLGAIILLSLLAQSLHAASYRPFTPTLEASYRGDLRVSPPILVAVLDGRTFQDKKGKSAEGAPAISQGILHAYGSAVEPTDFFSPVPSNRVAVKVRIMALGANFGSRIVSGTQIANSWASAQASATSTWGSVFATGQSDQFLVASSFSAEGWWVGTAWLEVTVQDGRANPPIEFTVPLVAEDRQSNLWGYTSADRASRNAWAPVSAQLLSLLDKVCILVRDSANNQPTSPSVASAHSRQVPAPAMLASDNARAGGTAVLMGKPDWAYVELGPVEAKGEAGSPVAQDIDKLRASASALGADAIMPGPNGGLEFNPWIRSLEQTAKGTTRTVEAIAIRRAPSSSAAGVAQPAANPDAPRSQQLPVKLPNAATSPPPAPPPAQPAVPAMAPTSTVNSPANSADDAHTATKSLSEYGRPREVPKVISILDEIPTEPHEVLGEVEVIGRSGITFRDLLYELARKAALLGADAIAPGLKGGKSGNPWCTRYSDGLPVLSGIAIRLSQEMESVAPVPTPQDEVAGAPKPILIVEEKPTRSHTFIGEVEVTGRSGVTFRELLYELAQKAALLEADAIYPSPNGGKTGNLWCIGYSNGIPILAGVAIRYTGQ